jgi:hypothetical protein
MDYYRNDHLKKKLQLGITMLGPVFMNNSQQRKITDVCIEQRKKLTITMLIATNTG